MRVKCLITGSCGFIFSNFIRKAIHNKSELEFVSVDRVENCNNLHNVYANKGHKFYIGDVTDPHFMSLIFKIERPEIVIHGADSKQGAYFQNNTQSTQILLEQCVKFGATRFIYISTDQVYGRLSSPTAPTWTEDCPYQPQTLYAASKAASELIVQTFQSYLQCDILRLCNLLGPRQASTNLVPYVINNILNDLPVVLQNKGENSRDWLYIDDACAAILALLQQPLTAQFRVYNLSGGSEFSDMEIFYEITKSLGKGLELLTSDRLPSLYQRFGSNCDKIKTLDWEPVIKIKKGIELCTNWYVNNKWFLKI